MAALFASVGGKAVAESAAPMTNIPTTKLMSWNDLLNRPGPSRPGW